MIQEKQPMSAKRAQRVKRRKTKLLVIISLCVLLAMAGGATLAYLSARGETVTNSFTPGNAECVLNDDRTVENTGNIPVYVRAAIIVNWENTSGQINGIAPKETTDYELTLGDGWSRNNADGYYYYNAALTVDGNTKVSTPVVASVNQKTTNSGYDLAVDILVEAIQSEGMGAGSAVAAWTKAQSALSGS